MVQQKLSKKHVGRMFANDTAEIQNVN